MRVYVAGKAGGCIGCVQALQQSLLNAGHQVTYDWTTSPIEKPFDADPHLAAREAEAMINGARIADLLILVVADGLYGAMTELGTALGAGTRVLAVLADVDAPPPRDSLFFHHPLYQQVSQEELFTMIEEGGLPGDTGRRPIPMRCG